MISKKLAIELNIIISEASGGSSGLRDEALLLSALNRPFQTFDDKDLYPSVIDKASAIFESIIINHPFIDGNKRMAYAFMRILLNEEGFNLDATQDEKYNFVIEASKGNMNFESIKNWILKHIKTIENE
ncbi:Toxin Doc [Mariniflexile rhizosphaerae]|uniref:type II toxin-antitoxin system death-on-curing family toxin n=1 Tax=unclassified Mariniflexile TaxID=2643887 RepID=UPI000CC002E5|nr:type II toxin-antitoxin system death-on-curing family toxin [Mariniflexile sp. TRM1-10]AXP79922.1 Toxin Doc [Mariniflexile sp. TRM1-10]PLB21075.1 MAG: Death-on-curing family protein [Flavobacteriaceae bacterium FS1-H7996/R]